MAVHNAQTSKLPQHLEDAFIKISFEELGKEGGESTHTSYDKWMDNASAQRVATELWSVDLFKKQHPKHTLVVTEAYNANLLSYPDLLIQPVNPDELVTTTLFLSLPRRASPTPGVLMQSIQFGAFRVAWSNYDFLVYIARVGFSTLQYILYEGDEQPINDLLMTVGLYGVALHDEILTFNQGFWQKDHALWAELQKASWKDVILEQERKDTIHKDIYGFFKSEQVYKDLSIPWKRGIIMHGPPGNGKTISIKAIMKECDSKGFAPLYVKSFQSWMGEEASMQIVFDKAREMSPCVLILEDLDSLINDQNRSFFLNQLDGFEGNDGILCIGTTNHFDRLDPALSTRPSRFDRKYLFDDPNFDERVLYGQYWQNKLKKNNDIAFPDSLVKDIANMTDKFSFAYLKEAFVSTLFLLATSEDASAHDFETVLRKVIKDLRKQLEDKPESIRPITASAVIPTAVPERQPAKPIPATSGVRGAPHGYTTFSLSRSGQPGQPDSKLDVAAMARSAANLGRGFIY